MKQINLITIPFNTFTVDLMVVSDFIVRPAGPFYINSTKYSLYE